MNTNGGRLLTVLATLAVSVFATERAAAAQESFSGRDNGSPVPPEVRELGASVRGPIDNVGYGPLSLASQSPFQSMRLAVPFSPPSTLPRGRWELRETTSWSKMWGLSDDYLINYEILSTMHSVTYGVTDDLQLELGVIESTRFGGSLDGFVRGFHDAFGIQQKGRDDYARGVYRFELKGKTGATIVVPEDRVNSSSEYLFFSVHQTLTGGSEWFPAISMSLSVKTDLRGSKDVTGASVETAASITFAKRLGDFYAYVSAGTSQYGDESFHGLPMRASGLSMLAALEWNVMEDVSLVLQQLRTSGAMKNYGAMSQASWELSLGIKVEVAPGTVFEMGMIENLVVFDNSPDFGLHFGLMFRLGGAAK